jgi:hypothetical protein
LPVASALRQRRSPPSLSAGRPSNGRPRSPSRPAGFCAGGQRRQTGEQLAEGAGLQPGPKPLAGRKTGRFARGGPTRTSLAGVGQAPAFGCGPARSRRILGEAGRRRRGGARVGTRGSRGIVATGDNRGQRQQGGGQVRASMACPAHAARLARAFASTSANS